MQQLEALSGKLDAALDKLTEGKEVSPEAFAEWRSHPITQMLMLEVKSTQLDAAQELLKAKSLDGYEEKLRGMVDVCEQIIEWRPETQEKED